MCEVKVCVGNHGVSPITHGSKISKGVSCTYLLDKSVTSSLASSSSASLLLLFNTGTSSSLVSDVMMDRLPSFSFVVRECVCILPTATGCIEMLWCESLGCK